LCDTLDSRVKTIYSPTIRKTRTDFDQQDFIVRTATSITKHLPRSAGRIAFVRVAAMFGTRQVESALANSLPHPGLQPWSCGYEDRQVSPGTGDV
jgi:hypothetical protein